MATTVNIGIPKAAISDQPNGPAQLDAAVDFIDAYLYARQTVANVANSTSGVSITAAAGWASVTQDWQVVAGRINIYVTATRTGATLTGPPDGNLANTQVLTFNDHRPNRRQVGSYAGGSASAPTEAGGECYLDTLGRWYLVSLHTSAAINTGDVIHVTFDYPI